MLLAFSYVVFNVLDLPQFASTCSLCRCVVSGAGKVAIFAVEKLIAFGAVPVTVSGIFCREGFNLVPSSVLFNSLILRHNRPFH
jgi:glutamate dehydrogenase/leucine dehydrogenase